MSEKEIEQIMRRLDRQDDTLKEIKDQLAPISKIYSNFKGFGDIGMLLLKVIIAIGAAGGVIYGFIKWLKT